MQSEQSSEETQTGSAAGRHGLTHVLRAQGMWGWPLVSLPQAKPSTTSWTVTEEKWELIP